MDNPTVVQDASQSAEAVKQTQTEVAKLIAHIFEHLDRDKTKEEKEKQKPRTVDIQIGRQKPFKGVEGQEPQKNTLTAEQATTLQSIVDTPSTEPGQKLDSSAQSLGRIVTVRVDKEPVLSVTNGQLENKILSYFDILQQTAETNIKLFNPDFKNLDPGFQEKLRATNIPKDASVAEIIDIAENLASEYIQESHANAPRTVRIANRQLDNKLALEPQPERSPKPQPEAETVGHSEGIPKTAQQVEEQEAVKTSSSSSSPYFPELPADFGVPEAKGITAEAVAATGDTLLMHSYGSLESIRQDLNDSYRRASAPGHEYIASVPHMVPLREQYDSYRDNFEARLKNAIEQGTYKPPFQSFEKVAPEQTVPEQPKVQQSTPEQSEAEHLEPLGHHQPLGQQETVKPESVVSFESQRDLYSELTPENQKKVVDAIGQIESNAAANDFDNWYQDYLVEHEPIEPKKLQEMREQHEANVTSSYEESYKRLDDYTERLYKEQQNSALDQTDTQPKAEPASQEQQPDLRIAEPESETVSTTATTSEKDATPSHEPSKQLVVADQTQPKPERKSLGETLSKDIAASFKLTPETKQWLLDTGTALKQGAAKAWDKFRSKSKEVATSGAKLIQSRQAADTATQLLNSDPQGRLFKGEDYTVNAINRHTISVTDAEQKEILRFEETALGPKILKSDLTPKQMKEFAQVRGQLQKHGTESLLDTKPAARMRFLQGFAPLGDRAEVQKIHNQNTLNHVQSIAATLIAILKRVQYSSNSE